MKENKHVEITVVFALSIQRFPYSVEDFYIFLHEWFTTFNQVHSPCMEITIKETKEQA